MRSMMRWEALRSVARSEAPACDSRERAREAVSGHAFSTCGICGHAHAHAHGQHARSLVLESMEYGRAVFGCAFCVEMCRCGVHEWTAARWIAWLWCVFVFVCVCVCVPLDRVRGRCRRQTAAAARAASAQSQARSGSEINLRPAQRESDEFRGTSIWM